MAPTQLTDETITPPSVDTLSDQEREMLDRLKDMIDDDTAAMGSPFAMPADGPFSGDMFGPLFGGPLPPATDIPSREVLISLLALLDVLEMIDLFTELKAVGLGALVPFIGLAFLGESDTEHTAGASLDDDAETGAECIFGFGACSTNCSLGGRG